MYGEEATIHIWCKRLLHREKMLIPNTVQRLRSQKEEFKNKIIEKHADLDIDFSKADSIKITEYTEGNRVKNLKVGNLNLSE